MICYLLNAVGFPPPPPLAEVCALDTNRKEASIYIKRNNTKTQNTQNRKQNIQRVKQL
jgi:hypothetical protein